MTWILNGRKPLAVPTGALGEQVGEKAWKASFVFCHAFGRVWFFVNKMILYTPWSRFILQFG